ncbi:MAG: phosphoribosylglycinamide formyltransferase [Candidatus Omnitrophica bacterium]|nr:phosphoribosylglycinamide formyltransferase [Candidatus Omnitrophota bacterium]MDD5574560.1 phosphoribosylglycinamide formyltransferase [Candidatus Omnitrophota bacterium]
MKRIAVFASGNGTNLQAIMDAISRGALKADLALVVSDKRRALALKRAARRGVKTLLLDPKDFGNRRDYDAALLGFLKKENIDVVVLAGFMRILSPLFVRAYKNRILNIHPALLPAFPGDSAIKDAHRYGVKVTGVTVHFVDEKVDHGPIIVQVSLPVRDAETLEDLEKRIHEAEHAIYPQAIASVLAGEAVLKGRRVLRRRKKS